MTIKLTAGQASAFNSPVIAKLFADETRTFPYADAMRLSDMVTQCQGRLDAHRTQVKKILADNNGTIEDSGLIKYETLEGQRKAMEAIGLLDQTEIEINGEKVKPKANWPNLTVVEATILRPLLVEETYD